MSPMTDGTISVQFLGTGGPYASGGRLQSCILLDGPSGRVLLDCGATALAGLARAGIDPDSIDAILLTHLHGDHMGGIPFLIVEALGSIRDHAGHVRGRPLIIAGPAATESRVRLAAEAFGYLEYHERALAAGLVAFVTLEPGRRTAVGPCEVITYPVPHTPEATALRVEYGSTVVAYTGDTAWSDVLVEVAADADLLIALAWTYETAIPTMLSYRTLEDHRDRLTCKRLVLTHIGPEMQRHAQALGDLVAEDGLVIRL